MNKTIEHRLLFDMGATFLGEAIIALGLWGILGEAYFSEIPNAIWAVPLLAFMPLIQGTLSLIGELLHERRIYKGLQKNLDGDFQSFTIQAPEPDGGDPDVSAWIELYGVHPVKITSYQDFLTR